MNHGNTRCRTGFTLVEILVVVIIIGIAGAVVIPSISSRDDLRVAAAARLVMADIIYAQNLAITQQGNHYTQFDAATQRYAVMDGSLGVVDHPVNRMPYRVICGAGGTAGMEQVTIVSAAFTTQAGGAAYSTLGFDELGTPVVYVSSGSIEPMYEGAIELQVGQARLRVRIEAFTGSITVEPAP